MASLTCLPLAGLESWDCFNQKVACQELLARGRKIAYFCDNHNSCKGTDVTVANWPHLILFVPFWGFTCQQHFNLFLRCNYQDPRKCFLIVPMCSEETKLNFPWNSRRQHSAQISLTPRKSQAEGGDNFIAANCKCKLSFGRQSIRSGFCRILPGKESAGPVAGHLPILTD